MVYRIIASALLTGAATPALAHPGSHAEIPPFELVAHLLSSPFHVLMMVAAVAACGLVLIRRRTARRNRTRR